MKYIKKEFGAYNLHIIKTNKFKTNTVRINFRSPIKKEEITIRNILCDIFTQSSKNYQTKRDLTIKSQDLYAADITTSTTRLGNYNNMNFYLNVLNDKYTEKGNFKSAIEFFTDIIFNPDIKDKEFNKDKLEIVKDICRKELLSIKEDVSSYSVIRMFESLDKNSPISYRMSGYIEDLEKINSKNLYEYYERMLTKDLVDIFVIGDINEEETIDIFKKTIKIRTLKKQTIPYIVNDIKPKQKRLVVKEKINTNQSKLVIGCKTNNLTEYERNYPLTLLNIILGGGVDSKLFKEVREKYSLCYTINSVPNKFDNILMIRAGIDQKNYDKTIELIDKILNETKKGKFTDNNIKIAKEYYNTALDEIEENQLRIIDNYFMKEIINTDTLEEKRIKINKVTKEELIKVAKKIKVDTIFLLEGGLHEKN